MATLTLTIAASAGDRSRVRDLDNVSPMYLGGVGTSGSNVAYGHGWRFVSVTLLGADTVTSAVLKLMKNGTAAGQLASRLTCTAEDNRAANWNANSPNRPGDPAIQSGSIAAETTNVTHTDGVVYDFPTTGTLQGTLGAAIEATVNRAGWASGNALGIVDNSDQDASASETFSRKAFHDFESATASSEPQIVITYTAGAIAPPPRRRPTRVWLRRTRG